MRHFYGQFLLHKLKEAQCPGWNMLRIGDYTLETHPALSLTPIITAEGKQYGFFLGYMISPANQYAPEAAFVPRDINLEHEKELEDWLYSWRGRYVAIINPTSYSPRLYLDAIGSMSCVYSVESQLCCSSPRLLHSLSWDDDLVRTYEMPKSGKFYPAGLTPFKSVLRLMPNFFLDLETMSVSRHWPQRNFKRDYENTNVIHQIVLRLGNNICSVAQAHDVYLSLTAGRDSRMLLAASRHKIDSIKFFTYDSKYMNVDLHIATKIAKKMRLSWSALPILPSSEQYLDAWQTDVGHCVAGAIWRHSQSFSQLLPGHIRIPGLGGEIGRCYYWRSHDQSDSMISAKALLQRMHLPTDFVSLQKVNSWIESLPSWLDAYDMLDLAYIEHRLGCWAGPSLYGNDQYFHGQLAPFGDRYLIEQMLSISPDYRQRQELVHDGIRVAWPELLSFPFNRYTGIRYHFSSSGVYHHLRQLKRAMLN